MSPSSNQYNDSKYQTNVVVVGAGLSGLAAAERLASSGIKTLMVEAQDRIGGRVQSIAVPCACKGHCKSETHHVELGATWFHGTVGNSAYDVAASEKLVPVDTMTSVSEHESNENPNSILHSSTVLFTTPAAYVASDGTVSQLHPDEVLSTVVKYTGAVAHLENVSDQTPPDDALKTAIVSLCEYSSLNRTERAAFRARDLLECSINGCATTSSLSARLNSQFEDLPGDNIRMPEKGMATVAQTLFQKASQSDATFDILRCAPVAIVDVSGGRDNDAGRARVVLESGDIIIADAVIWTPSVNVTKEAVNLGVFRPNLQPEKISALNDRGMDNIEQVHAILSCRPWEIIDGVSVPVLWEEGPDGIKYIDKHEDVTWETGVFCVSFNEHCNCATVWLSGRHAKNFLKLNAEESRISMEQFLCMVYRQTITVVELIKSRWLDNKFIRGSYSYPLAGSAENAVDVLSSPVRRDDGFPILCFAGEATHTSFYSTMHGAIDSGRREADRLLWFLRRSVLTRRSPNMMHRVLTPP